MLQYSVNKCVFSRHLKLCLPRSGSLKLSGREFQSDGPATEKARWPSVLIEPASRNHQKRRVADRRCCRAEYSRRLTNLCMLWWRKYEAAELTSRKRRGCWVTLARRSTGRRFDKHASSSQVRCMALCDRHKTETRWLYLSGDSLCIYT